MSEETPPSAPAFVSKIGSLVARIVAGDYLSEDYEELYGHLDNIKTQVQVALDVPEALAGGRISAAQVETAWQLAWPAAENFEEEDDRITRKYQKDLAEWYELMLRLVLDDLPFHKRSSPS